MKKSLVAILALTMIVSVFGCASEPVAKVDEKESLNEPNIINTIPAVIDPDYVPSEMEEGTIIVRHYEMSDGTWKTDECSYKYRLEVSGRMKNAAGESTYIILSNRPEITFDEAWKASGFSSNLEDYFDPEEAVIVGSIFYSDQKATGLQAVGIDTSILVRVRGNLYGRSFAVIDYAGGGREIGKITKLTAKENIPQREWETNSEEVLNALVYESGPNTLVLKYNNEYVLFEELIEEASLDSDLLYRGEYLEFRKVVPE